MKNIRLSLVDGKVELPDGLVDSIVSDLTNGVPELVVVSGVPGCGKTLTVEAVKKQLLAGNALTQSNIEELSSNGLDKSSASKVADSLPAIDDSNTSDSKAGIKPLYLVIWDEVAEHQSGQEVAILNLLDKGYSVIAVVQKPGFFANIDDAVFKNLTEYQLSD